MIFVAYMLNGSDVQNINLGKKTSFQNFKNNIFKNSQKAPLNNVSLANQ